MGEALNKFVEETQGMAGHFESAAVFSIGGWDVTQYVIWLFIAFFVVMAVVLFAAKKLQMVPTSKFPATVEYLYNLVRGNIAEDVIGQGFKKHLPFLATIFFFILICNFLGLVPGFKTSTGSISCTWALAAISFVYFNFYGLKTFGFFGYMKTLVPSGVPIVMVPIIWFLEFFSMIIRVLTLAVRLYGNMLAGHVALAVFGVAVTCFIQQGLFAGSMDLASMGGGILWFLLLVLMYAMECLVGFLQAFVFAILSSSYIGGAIHKH